MKHVLVANTWYMMVNAKHQMSNMVWDHVNYRLRDPTTNRTWDLVGDPVRDRAWLERYA